jgi:histidine ammonia-lyase
MAPTAARHCHRVLDNLEQILAIELLCAAQAVDFRREMLGPEAKLGLGTQAAFDLVRRAVSFSEHDEPLSPLIEAVIGLVAGDELLRAVDAAIGA